MRLKIGSFYGVFSMLVLLALVLGQYSSKAAEKPPAPDFLLNDINGGMVSLSQHKGKIILLDFWATWCPPCRMSIPELVALNKKYKDKGLVILGISVDDPEKVNDALLKAFVKKFKINYTILRINEQVMRDYFAYQQIGVPTMFIIDREGKILDMYVGFRPGVLEKAIKKVI
ncbi:MAG: TlpA family protein disulfide reductase [Deltaproteobacteria bacterium]|nr:TlpA family protein disulfide reductase [Deltaproteobacteria bacterium]